VLPGSLSLSVGGKPVVQGKLLKKVCHDDCEWSIEERNGERVLKLTLVKAVPTKVVSAASPAERDSASAVAESSAS
jgi:hypothetical protein